MMSISQIEQKSLLLELLSINHLKNRKNLLAFSAGVDSTALFFILLEKNIDFDIAIVNYNLRKQSKDEIEYAKKLAKIHNKKIFIKEVKISPPSIEKKAREIRYSFFEEIIKDKNYDNLITAHQLNDNFEWFLMQLSRGAGLVELIGMESFTKKEGYNLIRPMLLLTKDTLLDYLHKNSIRYFVDKSNFKCDFFRNYIRQNYSNKFLKEFEKGVRKSFLYLDKDKKLLEERIKIYNIKKLFIAKRLRSDYETLRVIDKIFKKLGYILSSSQKEEILKQKEGVIASKIAFSLDDKILIAPYVKHKLTKDEKEMFRKLKIPKLIRPYLAKEKISIQEIQNLM